MQVAPLSSALGVELKDFDLSATATAQEQAELRRLFLEHHLLAVRGQSPTPEDQDRFVEIFGPRQTMVNGTKAEYITNLKDDLAGATGTARLLYHSDGGYGARPGIGTSLCAINVSPSSPPTLYANAVRALDNLPDDLRARIEKLYAVNIVDRSPQPLGEEVRGRLMEADIPADADPRNYIRYEHPIVFKRPQTDRKGLFVSEHLTSHIIGLSPAEGEELLQELFSRIYARENVYAHYWRNGDVVIWDNMALQHARPAEAGAPPRHLRRLALDGWNTGDGVIEWPAPSFKD